jgi:hypothetical protein
MGLEVRVFFDFDLPWREPCGFLPTMGHGVAVRRRAWKELGGFPELVMEDFGFAFLASARGMYGVYARSVHCWESFPKDFDAFVVRLGKSAGGAAEFVCKNLRHFHRSHARWVETLDLVALLLWYPLMPLLVVNSFLSAYVCYHLWVRNIAILHPILPFLFLGMYLSTNLVYLSVTSNAYAALRHWFWAAAVYGATLPLASWRFCKHLFVAPTFERTPKGADKAPGLRWPATLTALLGVLALLVSWYWWSPFSPLLAAQGVSYLCFPIYRYLTKPTLLGTLIRIAAWVPGLLLLAGLYSMWQFPWR